LNSNMGSGKNIQNSSAKCWTELYDPPIH
jgi:hypothetical protein